MLYLQKNKKTLTLVFPALTLILFLSIFAGLFFGSEKLNFLNLSDLQETILLEIRFPRVMLAVGIGICLAVAGAGLQSLLRNPLAEPYLLGVSNGSALGTLAAFVFFEQFEFMRPVLSFLGAGLATFIVYRMASSRVGVNAERLILSGVIVTTLFSSILILLTSLLDATRLRSFTFWLLGDLSQATTSSFYSVLAVGIIGTVILLSQAKQLNLMMLGEQDAFDFGVEVNKTRLTVFVVASALVGVSVASGGSVGFVGLVIPHIVRLLLGSDNRLVIPASFLCGASFVVFADVIARVAISPRELPVGAITALIGCPLFIFLLRRT